MYAPWYRALKTSLSSRGVVLRTMAELVTTYPSAFSSGQGLTKEWLMAECQRVLKMQGLPLDYTSGALQAMTKVLPMFQVRSRPLAVLVLQSNTVSYRQCMQYAARLRWHASLYCAHTSKLCRCNQICAI